MIKQQFMHLIEKSISVGDSLNNPGGGTSTIISIDIDKVIYIRGLSRMHLSSDTIFAVVEHFSQSLLTTKDLKQYVPRIFDQKYGGHNCNCTFLLCILEKIGFTEGGILGSGRRGDPFFVKMRKYE